MLFFCSSCFIFVEYFCCFLRVLRLLVSRDVTPDRQEQMGGCGGDVLTSLAYRPVGGPTEHHCSVPPLPVEDVFDSSRDGAGWDIPLTTATPLPPAAAGAISLL